MQRFAGKTIVVKYGGAAMKDPTLKVCTVYSCSALLLRGMQRTGVVSKSGSWHWSEQAPQQMRRYSDVSCCGC